MPSFSPPDQMETTPLRCLINSISRFIHLMSCQTSKTVPFRNDFESTASILKHLKPILDEVDDDKLCLDANLWRECEGLDFSVNSAREFMEQWSPKMSRILSILQSEQLLTKIRSSSLEICCILCSFLRSLLSPSRLAIVQHCVQVFRSWEPDRITKHVEQAMKSKNNQVNSYHEHLAEIIQSLGIVSNQDLLKESIAVEKERAKFCGTECEEAMDQINTIIDLLARICDHMLKIEFFGTVNGISVPSYLRCPLSLNIMLDPVIVASGQTFERSSIQKWLDHGLRICPKTQQYLSHTNLILNYTIKALIANWFEENNLKLPIGSHGLSSQDEIRTNSFRCSVHSSDSLSMPSLDVGDAVRRLKTSDPSVSSEISSNTSRSLEADKTNHRSPVHSYTHSRTHSASSAVSICDYMPLDEHEKIGTISGYDETTTSAHVDRLVQDLKRPSKELQTAAAAELRFLSKHNTENRIIIGKCGAIRPLVSLLHSDIKKTEEHAVAALLNLSLNQENKARIAEEGVIEPLINILKFGTDAAKENSAATLFSLSVLEEYKTKIGHSGAIKPLVNLLATGTSRGKKDALTALFNLSICHENKARIVKAAAVKCLVELLDPSNGMVDKSVALLANLCTISEGRSAIAREGGIPLIVEIVDTGSNRGKENAAYVLLQMCVNSDKFCNLVLQEGAIPPLVALSQSGSARAKEKAQQLLSHFRSQREGTAARKLK